MKNLYYCTHCEAVYSNKGNSGNERTFRVIKIGDYKTDNQVGHIELVMRVHKHMKQMKERGRIIYIPDPIYGWMGYRRKDSKNGKE
ncbi:hypothetical protein SAMN05428961_106214 [Paenibacillus sp. OK060]|nr:hypothetical protein SAMN05428961_106214 [Paenibacillus sp. OK060]